MDRLELIVAVLLDPKRAFETTAILLLLLTCEWYWYCRDRAQLVRTLLYRQNLENNFWKLYIRPYRQYPWSSARKCSWTNFVHHVHQ